MRRGGALRHPDRSAPRLGLRFAVGTGHLCQIKFWLMQLIGPAAKRAAEENGATRSSGMLTDAALSLARFVLAGSIATLMAQRLGS
jgi:hypothetical protein